MFHAAEARRDKRKKRADHSLSPFNLSHNLSPTEKRKEDRL